MIDLLRTFHVLVAQSVLGLKQLAIIKAASFSTMGLFLIVDVALVVMVFAIWQQRGLKNAGMNT